MTGQNAYGDFSKYYDYLGWNKFAAGAAARLQSFIRLRGIKPKTVLDLACGTGELEKLMAKSGLEFVGVDLSGGMLRVARGKCRRTRFIKDDIAAIRLKKEFDLVLLLFDSANHMRSMRHLDGVFKNARRHLKAGGFFIFDILTAAGLERWEHIDIRRTKKYTVITNGYYYPDDLRADIFIEAYVKRGRLYDRVYQKIIEKTYPTGDIIKSLGEAGFDRILASSFDPAEELEETSRLWFVCG